MSMNISRKLLIAGLLGLGNLPAYGANYTGDLDRDLITACQYSDDADVVRLLIARGANVNAVGEYGRTALMYVASSCAAFEINSHLTAMLIAAGANVNAADKYGWTALIYASVYGQGDLVRLLLHAGANVNAVDKYGRTALDHANAGAKVNTVDEHGRTVLNHARANEYMQIAEILRWSQERSAWLDVVHRVAHGPKIEDVD